MSIETQKEKNYLFTKNLTDYKSESKCPLLSYFRGKTFQIKQDNGKDLYIAVLTRKKSPMHLIKFLKALTPGALFFHLLYFPVKNLYI